MPAALGGRAQDRRRSARPSITSAMSVEQGIDVPLCGLLDRSVVLDLDDVRRALDIGRAARLATERATPARDLCYPAVRARSSAAAAACPALHASAGSLRHARWVRKPAAKASPAPVVSTTSAMSCAGTSAGAAPGW